VPAKCDIELAAGKHQAPRWLWMSGLNITRPDPSLPSPLPGAVAAITTGPAEFLAAGGNVQCVQPLRVLRSDGPVFFGPGNQVQRAGRPVHHRRAGDPNLGRNIAAWNVAAGAPS